MENLFDEAIRFAVAAHAGYTRKGCRQPYILHPMEAAAIVGSMTDDPEILAAAVLHDVVEDAEIALEEIEARFGRRVMELVASETEDKRRDLPAQATWKARKQEAIDILGASDDIAVKMLYLGDKLSNLRSMHRGWKQQGDAFWLAFNQRDPQMHIWYYQSIADALAELSGTDAWQELDRLIHDMKTKLQSGK